MDPEQLVDEIARLAADKKAIDIVELDLRGVLGYTDYFLVCSGSTGRQVKAIQDGILEGLKHERRRCCPRTSRARPRAAGCCSTTSTSWCTSSRPQMREFYRLEQLWGEAPARVARLTLPGLTAVAARG